ncbi:MAG: Wzz/FepE/Etk N-terminal domain-containing protein, partial [Alphaproteobacteria bacterium]|nr:Wzz/FepE/Etk N-terminal domain-containing protein [Alphaproteobacteria bacterium]
MEELDLKQLFKIFWNKRLHIISIVLVFLIIGSIYSFAFVKPKYKADTKLVLAQTEASVSDGNSDSITTTDVTLNQKLVPTYSELIKTKGIIRQVIKELNLNIGEDELKRNVTVKSVKDTELIQITVTSKNPTDAKNIANKIAEIFSDKIKEIYKINNINVVEYAEEPTHPSNINHIRDLAIFIAAGLVVA